MQIANRESFAVASRKRLPYDAEVEYLESTGTQYIDTGIAPTAQTSAVLTGQFSRLQGRTRFGCRGAAYNGQFCVLSTGNDRIRFDLGSGTFEASQWEVQSDAKSLGISARASAASLTSPAGVEYVHSFTSTITFSNRPILLFAYNNGGTPVIAQSTVVSSLQISESGVLVRDFIPVRVGSGSSAVGYMYDRAHPDGGPSGNGLYGNNGTGSFTIGPDKTA